jgi:ABC-type nickel/cobalt efflux system permease component RcnA
MKRSEFVKKWGLAPATTAKTLRFPVVGRCLYPFFHKLPFLITLAASLFFAGNGRSHPVPRRQYDRTIVARLTATALIVDYRLDLDEYTAIMIDLPAVLDKAELAELSTPQQFYDAFARAYSTRVGDGLTARLDNGAPLEFKCVKRLRRTVDDNGAALDHLRFDFLFQASWKPAPQVTHVVEVREDNYPLEEGRIAFTLREEASVELAAKDEPDKSLWQSTTRDLKPGDDHKRRRVSARFMVPAASVPDAIEPEETATEPQPPSKLKLLHLLMDPRRGLWLLAILAAGLGAIHALTPGHGKTLVAAYLVGERGTVWHAIMLGLVTTITHTGTVIALAVGLLLVYPDTVPANVKAVLGLVGGVLIAGMGMWLLLRRLGGQVDHIHLGGHGHHHHHHHHHHDHPAHHDHGGDLPHDHVHPTDPRGIAGLILLGVQGGIIPCWDAIAMLGFGISAQRVWLALVLLLAFSVGLAAVLVVTGILVVRLKGFAASRWGNGWVVRSLPFVSAILVTLLGLWLCYDALFPGSES